jgi:hypothetical protein
MSAVVRQSKSNNSPANPWTVTFDSPVLSGSVFAVLMCTDVPTSVNDSVSSSYGSSRAFVNDATHGENGNAFVAVAGGAGSNTVSVNFSGTPGDGCITIVELTGCDTTTPVSDAAAALQAISGTTTVTFPSVTPGAGDVVLAFVADVDSFDTAMFTAGAGLTAIEQTGGGAGLDGMLQKQEGVAGGALVATATMASEVDVVTVVLAIKAAGGGGTVAVAAPAYRQPVPMRPGPGGFGRAKPFRLDTANAAPLQVNASSSVSVPLGGSAAATVLVQAATIVTLALAGSADGSVVTTAPPPPPAYHMAIPMRPTAGGFAGGRPFQFDSSNPPRGSNGDSALTVQLTGSSAGSVLVQGASSASIAIASSSSATIAAAPVPPYQMVIPMRPKAGGFARGKPFAFDTSIVAGTAHADSSLALTLTGVAAATVQVQGATAVGLTPSGSADGSVQVQGVASSPLPITGSANAAVAIQAASSSASPLSGQAAAAVLVQGTSSAPVPLTGVATGTTVITSTGDSARAVPLAGAAAATVLVQAASVAPVQLTGASAGTIPIRADSTAAVPLRSLATIINPFYAKPPTYIDFDDQATALVFLSSAGEELMGPLKIKTGETGQVTFVLKGKNKQAEDLTGATNLTWTVTARDGTVRINKGALTVIGDPKLGRVGYTRTGTEFLVPETLSAEASLVRADGSIGRFPNNGYATVTVIRSLTSP